MEIVQCELDQKGLFHLQRVVFLLRRRFFPPPCAEAQSRKGDFLTLRPCTHVYLDTPLARAPSRAGTSLAKGVDSWAPAAQRSPPRMTHSTQIKETHKNRELGSCASRCKKKEAKKPCVGGAMVGQKRTASTGIARYLESTFLSCRYV